MGTYMVRYKLSPAHRNHAIHRFMTDESAMTPPEGVTVVGRWHSVEGNGGWNVIDAPDAASVADWILRWSDLLRYEVTPVIADEELGALFRKHNLG